MFNATLNVTVPLPVPVVRPVNVIHEASVVADQSHDDAAVTEIELLFVPVARNETSFGVTVTLQLAPDAAGGVATLPSCVIFTVWPATTIDAARVVPGFDAIVNVTFPVPVPVDPPLTTTHAASA